MTRSASLRAVISGVVTTTASLAGAMAVMNPASIPAGQSMRIKSRSLRASTIQRRELVPKLRGSLERGLVTQRREETKRESALVAGRGPVEGREGRLGRRGGESYAGLDAEEEVRFAEAEVSVKRARRRRRGGRAERPRLAVVRVCPDGPPFS
ncbi:uncharacterized protein A4U43_C01F19280 [Asparagus officinalis]|uniref:Uncharacterized protein n=1 Tax=Asparagus officinalis TaxID=4686 RepID=A0A5P1FQU0_ASPOF|nr:uncharacterized protein A4U43_C01F19280 [Asparagus officinalis]